MAVGGAGQLIGNSGAAEQLVHGFSPLDAVRIDAGNRRSSEVPGTTNLDKLDFIIWVGFGDDEDFDIAKWGLQKIGHARKFDVQCFELFPRGYSPFQDGWEAVLLDDGQRETLVWRQWREDVGETHELSLPQGEFTSVIALATDWFSALHRSRLATVERTPDEKPGLVHRVR